MIPSSFFYSETPFINISKDNNNDESNNKPIVSNTISDYHKIFTKILNVDINIDIVLQKLTLEFFQTILNNILNNKNIFTRDLLSVTFINNIPANGPSLVSPLLANYLINRDLLVINISEAVLYSDNASANFNYLVSYIVSQILLYINNTNTINTSKKSNTSNSNLTLDFLIKYIQEHNAKLPQYIVIIIENFEILPVEIISKLILCLHFYNNNSKSKLNFYIIFFSTTNFSHFETLINSSSNKTIVNITDKLLVQHINLFNSSSPSMDWFENLIYYAFIQPNFPFLLTGTIFNELLELFLRNDLSVISFLHYMNYLILEFSSNSLARLSLLYTHNNSFDKLTDYEQKTISELYPNKKNAQQYAKDSIKQFQKYRFNYPFAFDLFFVVSQIFDTCLPKSRLYLSLLFIENESYLQKIFPNLENASFDDIKKCVNSILDYLSRLKDNIIDDKNNSMYTELVDNFQKHFSDITNQFSNIISGGNTSTNHPNVNIAKIKRVPNKRKFNSLLASSGNHSEFKITLKNVLINFVKKYLQSPEKLDLYQAFVLTKDKLTYSPLLSDIIGHRYSVENAVSNPTSYYPNKNINNSDIDVFIFNKIFNEYGKKVNIHDWFMGFKSLLDINENSEENEVKIQNLKFRFMQCINDFELLGYFKHNIKKPEAVTKTIF